MRKVCVIVRALPDERRSKVDEMKMRFYGIQDLDRIPQIQKLPQELRRATEVVGQVLPFRVNHYVIEELIDWNRVPEDPIFQLTFLQKEMLSRSQYHQIDQALESGDQAKLKKIVQRVRYDLNPHPAGQLSHNIPKFQSEKVPGIQHKYRETCLVFPRPGQTCFSYCTFCFRWAQFVGMKDLTFATDQAKTYVRYISAHPEITDVLVTGGDPLIMSARVLEKYLDPLLEIDHVQTIRIGTKVLSYWPNRFLTDRDAEDLLRLFEKVRARGKHLAFMAHFNHPREMVTSAAKRSVERVLQTGAQIRTQSPLLAKINDDPRIWTKMWNTQVKLGMIPYYLFVERDTGPKRYFQVPLVRALKIYSQAIQSVSGLARTARGPSMSTFPGKVMFDGVSVVRGEKVMVFSFVQARVPHWVKRPFFARFDPEASWLDELEPAFGEERFFFEEERLSLSKSKTRESFRQTASVG